MTDECAISMCDNVGSPLVLWCPNGHYMHNECIEGLVKASYPDAPTCPMCRNDSASIMSLAVAPSIAALFLSPHSSMGGVLAMRIGISDYIDKKI